MKKKKKTSLLINYIWKCKALQEKKKEVKSLQHAGMQQLKDIIVILINM